MFKTLASFFKSTAADTEQEETDEALKDSETPEPEQTDDTPEPEPAAPAAVVLGENETKLSNERYQELLAIEKDAKKFGATAAERAAFHAESKQLYTWYEGMKALGIKGAQLDASDEEKGNKKPHKSSVTQEAEAMQKKREKK